MVDAARCQLCGRPFRPRDRRDRKFCGASCRSLAYRQRQRPWSPAAPSGGLPSTPPLSGQELRPPSPLVKLVIELEEKLAAFSTQRDADAKRAAELETAVAQAADRESQIAAQNWVLQQELAVARARIDELEQRPNDSWRATQQPEDESARRKPVVISFELPPAAPPKPKPPLTPPQDPRGTPTPDARGRRETLRSRGRRGRRAVSRGSDDPGRPSRSERRRSPHPGEAERGACAQL